MTARAYSIVSAHVFEELAHPGVSSSRLSTGPPHFLLVVDDPIAARAHRRVLEAHGSVSVVRSVAEARLTPEARPTGIVIDDALPDSSAFDMARAVRAHAPKVPILIVSWTVDASRLDAADEIRATCLLSPIERRQLDRFAQRAIEQQSRVAVHVREWAERYGLSAAETLTLRLAADGVRREELRFERGVSENTIKHQVGALLAKVGAPTLAEATLIFLRELAAKP